MNDDSDNDAGAAPDASSTDASNSGTAPTDAGAPGGTGNSDGGDSDGGSDAAVARGGQDSNSMSSDATVTFDPPAPVACPGLNCLITAVPSEPEGTFAWSVASGATIVDANGGGVPGDSTSAVQFCSFQPDNVNGAIPSQSVVLTLQYTPPGGDPATYTVTVTVHAITFEVDNPVINSGLTCADESADPNALVLQQGPGSDTMETEPQVTINVDASCTASGTCASNYQVGWLQTVLTNTRDLRYTDTDVATKFPVPIMDGDKPQPQPPFYGAVTPFTSNNQSLPARHSDSPFLTAAWQDSRYDAPRPPAPKAQQLRRVRMGNSFNAFLVVQNLNWATANPGLPAFLFLRNFSWSVFMDVTVDTSQPVGQRATCTTNAAPQITALSPGQGSLPNPALTSPNANDYVANNPSATATTAAANMP